MPQSIEAELTYIIDDGQPSVRYVDWPEEAHKAHVASYENRLTHIYNGRLSEELFDLHRHGFLLATEPTKVRNFYDQGEIKRIYYPETAELIKRNSGGEQVYVFDHTIRTPVQEKHKEGWVRNPVRYVHNDYTELSAPQRVKDFFPNEYETLLKKRFAIIQTWRSILPTVETEPLALCDGRTIPKTGFIRNQRRYKNRTAETYHISYNSSHRWYYFPLMKANEALVFKVYDTDPNVGVKFMAHTAFEDPTGRANAPARQNIEIRALVFF
jgi:hypothetical protein